VLATTLSTHWRDPAHGFFSTLPAPSRANGNLAAVDLLNAPVETVPISELIEHPHNPRRGDVDVVAESIRTNGFYGVIVRQKSTGYILAGNHRTRAAKLVGLRELPVQTLDVDDNTARRILAVDNRSNDVAGYDTESLIALLQSLDDLVGSGYDAAALDDLLEQHDQSDLDQAAQDGLADLPERALSPGELLSLADVTFGEPKHQVSTHDVWQVGRHTLVIARVSEEHNLWRHRLADGVIFAPYPEPFITASTVALDHPLLLVQPNKFLAGMLLDKHESIFPGDTIERVSEEAADE
jgi:hypothetical protein